MLCSKFNTLQRRSHTLTPKPTRFQDEFTISQHFKFNLSFITSLLQFSITLIITFALFVRKQEEPTQHGQTTTSQLNLFRHSVPLIILQDLRRSTDWFIPTEMAYKGQDYCHKVFF